MSVYDALINVPGTFVCPRCKFVQVFSVMRASDGAVGVRFTPDPDRMTCPNDGELLRPYTWQERVVEAEDGWSKALSERDLLTRKLAAAMEGLRFNDYDPWTDGGTASAVIGMARDTIKQVEEMK